MKNKILVTLAFLFVPVLALAQGSLIQTDTEEICVTPTIETGAYTAGDLVGGKQTISNAFRAESGSGLLQTIQVHDIGAEGKNLEIVFFTSNPSGTTFTENSAFDPADTDLTKIVCPTTISSHSSFNDNGTSTAQNIGCVIDAGSPTIYAAAIVREAVTYDSTSALTFCFGFVRD